MYRNFQIMKININNYEEYFIDYFDGNLDFFQNKKLFEFLDNNPEIKEEFMQFEEIKIEPENIKFPLKGKLKKNAANQSAIKDANFEDFCIAKLENQLSDKQIIEFEEYLSKSPERQKTYNLYLKTKLEPNPNILFNKKASLKKFSIQTRKIISFFSVAASIIIIVSLYFYSNNFVVQDESIFADKLDSSQSQHEKIVNKNIDENKKSEKAILNIEKSEKETIKILDKTEKKIAEIISDPLQKNEINSEKNIINSNLKDKIADNLFNTRVDSSIYIILNKTNMSNDSLSKKNNLQQEISSIDKDSKKKQKKKLIAAIDTSAQKQEDDYISAKQYFVNLVKKKLFKVNKNEKLEFWNIADASLSGINRITGGKMKLEEKSNKNSSIIEFSSKKFALALPIKKRK